jgi:hypothetical protein
MKRRTRDKHHLRHTMSDIAAKTEKKYITPIDACELAVRLAESYNRMKRPPGASGAAAFFSMEQEAQDAWMRAATAAMDYWRECIKNLQRPS